MFKPHGILLLAVSELITPVSRIIVLSCAGTESAWVFFVVVSLLHASNAAVNNTIISFFIIMILVLVKTSNYIAKGRCPFWRYDHDQTLRISECL